MHLGEAVRVLQAGQDEASTSAALDAITTGLQAGDAAASAALKALLPSAQLWREGDTHGVVHARVPGLEALLCLATGSCGALVLELCAAVVQGGASPQALGAAVTLTAAASVAPLPPTALDACETLVLSTDKALPPSTLAAVCADAVLLGGPRVSLLPHLQAWHAAACPMGCTTSAAAQRHLLASGLRGVAQVCDSATPAAQAWLWQRLAPCLLVATPPPHGSLRNANAASSVQTELAAACGDDTPPAMVLAVLALAAVRLGRVRPRRFQATVRKLAADLQRAALVVLQRSDASLGRAVHGLASVLFKAVVALSEAVSVSQQLPALLDLVEADDGVASAVAAVVAEVALAGGVDSVSLIFSRLRGLEAGRRRGAVLTVVSEMVALCTAVLGSSDRPLEGGVGRDAAGVVCDHLLDHLTDEDVVVRGRAADLFAVMDAGYVVPRLAKLLASEDVGVRAAGERSLAAVVQQASSAVEATLAVLDTARHGSPQDGVEACVPASPGELEAGGAPAVPPPSQWQDRIVHLLARSVPTAHPGVLPAVLRKLFAAPQDELLVRFFRMLVPRAAAQADVIVATCSAEMEAQPGLSAEVLESNTVGAAMEVQSLLFSRLSPLLVLRMLPGGLTVDGSRLGPLLATRMEQVYEFDDVRRLAAEVFGRLLPRDALAAAEATLGGTDAGLTKIQVYGAMHALLAGPADPTPSWHADMHAAGQPLVPLLLSKLRTPGVDAKLEMGAIEALACLALHDVARYEDAVLEAACVPPLVVELDGDGGEQVLETPLVGALCAGVVTAGDLPPRVCFGNALVAAARRLSPVQALAVGHQVGPSLVATRDPPPLVAAVVLSLLYTLSMVAKRPAGCSVATLHAMAAHGMGHAAADVRLAALKLWGVVVAVVEAAEVVAAVGQDGFDAAVRRLQALANMDASPDVRQVAGKLIDSLEQ